MIAIKKIQTNEVKPSMLYIGLDIHSKWTTIAQIRHLTRDGCWWLAGKRQNRDLMTDESQLEGRFTDLAV
jgi:hypothetical protein